jgi:hypothetical protein
VFPTGREQAEPLTLYDTAVRITDPVKPSKTGRLAVKPMGPDKLPLEKADADILLAADE